MILRCNRCGRILTRAAATLETAQGRASYGGTCAVRMGLIEATQPRAAARPRRVDVRQLVLEGAAA